MAYDLIEKHKYPAYDVYSGVAQRGTFTMSFGHLVSTSTIVNALIEQCEAKAIEEGAVMLGLEIWEETSLLEKRYKCTSYLYDPLGRGQTVSEAVAGVTLIIVSVILAVFAIIGLLVTWLITSAITSVAEMDWAGGPVAVIRWGVYGIIAAGIILVSTLLIRQRKKA